MTDLILEAMSALAEYGSIRKAAAAIGVPASTMQSRLARASAMGLAGGPPIPPAAVPPEGFAISRNSGEYDAAGELRRQWIGSKRDAGDDYVIPAGHVLKGESALLDPSGRVLAKWVKTTAGAGDGFVDAMRQAFAEFDGAAPAIPAPDLPDDDLLTVYPIPDLHFGMLAWGKETGENYDVEIATDLARRSLGALVDQSRKTSRAVLLVLGDYFHANDSKAVTPGNGHRLDVDGRWPRVFLAGAKLMTELAATVAAKHGEVEIVCLPGNHDLDAAPCLAVALSLFFASTPRITVNLSPAIAWYYRFGRVLLGATHGHTMKPERMVMMMATDRASDWGETVHRSMFFGHIHHESARECAGARVESFGSPAARDAYNAGGGYRSARSLSALTFHRYDGEIGRHRVNIQQGAAA